MARDISTDTKAAIAADTVYPIFLFEAVFDEGTVRFWSGYGDLAWNSQTWTGAGSFASISPVSETGAIQANSATVGLNGIDSTIISLALTYEYRDRPCTLYLGFINQSNHSVTDAPFTVLAGRMDTMAIEDSGDTGSISINIESSLIDLQRPKERRYTHEEQIREYPGDLGLEYVISLQDKQIPWGIAAPSTTTSSGNSTISQRDVF